MQRELVVPWSRDIIYFISVSPSRFVDVGKGQHIPTIFINIPKSARDVKTNAQG
jgi:hypothetical protein